MPEASEKARKTAEKIVDPFHHDNFSSTGDRVVREITAAIQSERDRKVGSAPKTIASLCADIARAAGRITELESDLQYQTEARVRDAKDSSANFLTWKKAQHDPLKQHIADLEAVLKKSEDAQREYFELNEKLETDLKLQRQAIKVNLDEHQQEVEELKRELEQATIAVDQASDALFKKDALIENITRSLPTIGDVLASERVTELENQLSPSPCGVKGHYKVDWTDWTERRAGERRVMAHICTPYSGDCVKFHPGRVGNQRTWRSDKPGNSRIHVNRRVTNSGGYCARCGEVEEAKLEAMRHVATGCGLACRPRSNLDDLVTAIKQETGRAVTAALEAAGQYIPGDLRALGWSVATHNDYRQDGKFHTFWLLTKSGQCVKGEGESDAEALNQIRVAILGKAVKG